MGNSWSGACLNTAFITDFHLNWSAQTTKKEILVNSIKLFIDTYKHIILKKKDVYFIIGWAEYDFGRYQFIMNF